MLLAAVHESGYGPKRRFAALRRYVGNLGVKRTCLVHA